MYKRILVPLDGSETSQRGLTEALGLARHLHASLVLLHVVSDLQWLVDPLQLGDPLAVRKDLHAFGENLLAQAAKTCDAAGVAAQTRLRDAAGAGVGNAIVEEITKSGCDLVVMGTHGRRGVARLLLGNDASAVVSTAQVPVLLVRLDAAIT